MNFRTAYCATHDRPVRILLKGESGETVDTDDIVCMEHGDTCTGSMCPIFDVPSVEMRETLEAYRAEMEELEPEIETEEGTP